MNATKDLEKFLEEIMSAEVTDIQSPHLSLVNEARQKIFTRKKIVREEVSLLNRLILFFTRDFKFYPIGLSLLLISGGIFYISEPDYNTDSATHFMNYNEVLSITNTTISVNSSTMLTSIPTLVIRN